MKRTPIKIQRIPIIIERLPWDAVYEKFIKLIHFAARNVYRVFGTESVDDLAQEGQLVLYRCWLLYGDRGWENFTPAFKAALWRKLRELSGKKKCFTVDLDTLAENGIEPEYHPDFDGVLDDSLKLSRLAEAVRDNPIATKILNEFVEPSSLTIWEGEMDLARKQMLYDFGHPVVVPKSVAISKKIVKRSLKKMGIKGCEFELGLTALKEAIANVYEMKRY